MTIQELKNKVASLEISLEFMRINQDDFIKKMGKRRYDDLLNEVLDQYRFL
jgi:hypothetical protein